jgi:DNA-binding XRE family transcriptional regulator
MILTLNPAAVKSRRLMAGMTQVQLAAKVGVHPITMVRYETGAINPRPDTAQRLARALECQIADIASVTDGTPAANAVGA